MSARHVLLTGGSGMLGRAVRTAFEQVRPDDSLDAPTHAELDLLDAGATRDYVSSGSFDLVIHAAARVGGIGANIEHPAEFLAENASMGLNVLSAALSASVPALINVGSSCMYPKDWRQPMREDDLLQGPLEPTNEGYALAKLLTERYCRYASDTYGVAFRTVVPSNLYGPHDHFELDRAHLVAAALSKVHTAKAAGSPVVDVWGDGTARREFTFVGDVAAWLASIAGHVESLPQTVNVGFGEDATVRDYYEAVARVVGYEGEFRFDRDEPAGMRQKLMDSSLARECGWMPTTNLMSGLQTTYEWYLGQSMSEVPVSP